MSKSEELGILVFIGDGIEDSPVSLVLIGGISGWYWNSCLYDCLLLYSCYLALELDLKPTISNNLSLWLEALVLLTSSTTSTIISSTWETTGWALYSFNHPTDAELFRLTIESLWSWVVLGVFVLVGTTSTWNSSGGEGSILNDLSRSYWLLAYLAIKANKQLDGTNFHETKEDTCPKITKIFTFALFCRLLIWRESFLFF